MTLLRFVLLLALAYVLWLRVRPHLTERRQLKRPAKPKEERYGGKLPHEILGISEGAEADEVQRAYVRLVSEHHPDKSATLAAAVQREASDKTKAILWAYDRLKKR